MMNIKQFLRQFALVSSILFAAGCGSDTSSSELADEALNSEYGKPLMAGVELSGKDDSVQGVGGLPLSVNDGPMVVWDVQNQWEDVETAQGREAGLAWDANSGLDWNEKYGLWVASLAQAPGVTGTPTFSLTTPYGRTLQSPYLECAETAIFLRAAFASWYQLPFFMAAWTPEGTVYFGHFGIRYENGRYRNMPDFRDRYVDYSSMSPEEYAENWPSDSKLFKRYLTSKKDDENVFLGEGMYTGAYLDQVFLNKRAGHFMLYLLTYLGSIHLASPSNMFNLAPEATREGDVLLHRWKKQGVGHTMIVMTVDALLSGQMEVEVASGSMPRRQPKWENSGSSKYRFTTEKAGGPGLSDDGYAFSALGGGIKRWRFAKGLEGRYYNVVGERDAHVFIASSDHVTLAERVATYDGLLGELPPEEKRDLLLEMIQAEREHLSKYPASCAARIRREKAFDELYAHQAAHYDETPFDVDQTHRVFEDYVFGELSYEESRTCCWNSTNGAMYQAIVAYALEQVEGNEACTSPPVFKMVDGGYGGFEEYATAMGVIWPQWTPDESCPQAATVLTDTEEELSTEYCALEWESTVGGEPEINLGCEINEGPGCDGCACESCVCLLDSYCCNTAWDSYCVNKCNTDCHGGCF
jgi:hypothetical protein